MKRTSFPFQINPTAVTFLTAAAACLFTVSCKERSSKEPSLSSSRQEGMVSTIMQIADADSTSLPLSKSIAYNTIMDEDEPMTIQEYWDNLSYKIEEKKSSEDSLSAIGASSRSVLENLFGMFDNDSGGNASSSTAIEPSVPSSSSGSMTSSSQSSGSGSSGSSVSSSKSYSETDEQRELRHKRTIQNAEALAKAASSGSIFEDYPTSGSEDTDAQENEGIIRPSQNTLIKAMFASDAKILSDSRVGIILLEDIYSDGMLIPSGARLSARCSVQRSRMELSVGSIIMSGQRIDLNLEACDFDGSRGILISSSDDLGGLSGAPKARISGPDILSKVSGLTGGLIPVPQIEIFSGGDESVYVPSGYVFHLQRKMQE